MPAHLAAFLAAALAAIFFSGQAAADVAACERAYLGCHTPDGMRDFGQCMRLRQDCIRGYKSPGQAERTRPSCQNTDWRTCNPETTYDPQR